MPVIDWLELLWKEAEEGAEVSLPGELDLRPVKAGTASRAGETADPAEGTAAASEERTTAQGRTLPAPADSPAVERLYRSAAHPALTALYHRVRETVSPGLPGVSGHGGTVVVREEVSAAPGLTEEGLDRSLRRDSRRYDGGMSIY